MYTIDLHENAKKNFNAKADELLLKLKPVPQEKHNSGFRSKVPTQTILPDQIISHMTGGLVDPSGNNIAVFFFHKGLQIGFIDESYNEYMRFCENIQRVPAFANFVSLKTLSSEIFNWCREKYYGLTNEDLIAYLKSQLESEVAECEIWIPLYKTEVENDLVFSNLRITTIDNNILTQWYNQHIEDKDDSQIEDISEYHKKLRDRLEGYAVAIYKATAEPVRAFELATLEVDALLDYLRFFSKPMFFPRLTSQLTTLGKEHQMTSECFVIVNNRLTASHKTLFDHSQEPWRISKEEMEHLFLSGLKQIEVLHSSTAKTEFQIKILESLRLYSNSLLQHNISSRLIYTLSAVEGLLLKNSTEPIQDSVSRRLAFYISPDKNSRKDIIKNFKEVYSIRSKFIHHAEQVTHDEYNLIAVFFLNIWKLFLNLLHARQFRTKSEFIEYIEDRILS